MDIVVCRLSLHSERLRFPWLSALSVDKISPAGGEPCGWGRSIGQKRGWMSYGVVVVFSKVTEVLPGALMPMVPLSASVKVMT